jgi:cysteine-rich repeat protein
VTDPGSGEQCDDGTAEYCDGCDPQCHLEFGLSCGDGFVLGGCGEEECDDANSDVGDGCGPACTLEVAAGGGSRATDCLTGWSVDNPTNVPLQDANGAFGKTQLCTDDDARCDFDGGTPGSCTFHVHACANLTNMTECRSPTRLAGWQLVQPSAAKAAKHADLAAVRAALATVPGAIVGPDQRNVCSDWASIVVPLRGSEAQKAGKVLLKSTATDYEEKRDIDKLQLVCVPAAP